jgi:hypothetical protein
MRKNKGAFRRIDPCIQPLYIRGLVIVIKTLHSIHRDVAIFYGVWCWPADVEFVQRQI